MSLFHRHRWVEVARRFVPPKASKARKVWNVSEDFIREFTFGFTVVELRCEECGNVAERKLTGDATGEG